MNGNLVVGAVIVILLAGAIYYMVRQHRKGISSCGCKNCNCCGRGGNDRETPCNHCCDDKKN